MSSKAEKRRNLPPGQTPIKQHLRWGKDHPTISGSFPKIDLKSWTLTVDGEVEKPLKLSWDDVLKFPKFESVSDFHCVEGWSVLNCKWEGVPFKYLVDLVKPKATVNCRGFRHTKTCLLM
jgi:DMSO/TMAO reductase YedYZ molybdopterin-dependent catalytic subunit